ncbi:MAG: PDZ domain-containing protein, partial [Candidatus Methylomirabilales bacterium]
KGGPAARGGVRPGDLIKEVNRREVTSLEEYNRALAESSQGIDLFLVQRGEAFLFLAIKAKG